MYVFFCFVLFSISMLSVLILRRSTLSLPFHPWSITAFQSHTTPATDTPYFKVHAHKMGMSWSSMSECLGDFSNNPASPSRYNRLPPSRRLASTTSSTSNSSGQQQQPVVIRQRCVSDEKMMMVSSLGAAIAPPPPPLIPDSNSVYNLLEDEQEDVCPTCLETYAKDNPKISSNCGHSFHLQCIVAWETTSGSRFCPICAKVMQYVEA